MRKLLLCLLFLSILVFPSWVHADPSTYLNIPPTNAFDKIHSDNGTISAVNYSMPLTVKGGSGISVQSSNASHTLTITNTATPNTHNGSYNTTQANNVNINSGGYKINFINGTGATVHLQNSGSGNQVNVTVSATGVSSGVTSLNALTGALTIACVSGNTTCTTSGGNTITVNTAYNVVVTGGSAQTISKVITHAADVILKNGKILKDSENNNIFIQFNNNNGSSGSAVLFNKPRDSTNSLHYRFLDVGGLTGDANGAAFWRGLQLVSPPLTISSVQQFPITSMYYEYNSLTDPTTRNFVIEHANTNGNGVIKNYLWRTNGVDIFSFNSTGLINKYNSINTKGWGVPAIYGSGRLTGLTAASGTVASYTVGASDGTFEVSGDILATTSVNYSFDERVTWTDETGTGRTMLFQFSGTNISGLTTVVTNTNGPSFYGIPYTIRAQHGTTITIASSAGGTYTNVTYNIEGFIKQIS